MGNFELDKFTVNFLYDWYKRNRLDVQPDYQRSKAWPDKLKYELVDTVLNEWPMGLIMLNVDPRVDADGHPLEYHQVVDGQQRLRCLFEFKDGIEDWTRPTGKKVAGFQPYGSLSEASQERFDNYRVSVALMKDYETDEILDVFSRLQNSRPLRIGERVKALRTLHKSHIRDIANHQLFNIAGSAHKTRDAHWNLGAVFYKGAYRNNPLDRQEFENLDSFLKRDQDFEENKANKATTTTKHLMNLVQKVVQEATQLEGSFTDKARSARLIKWTFACITLLDEHYAIAGREHLLAKGLVEYHSAREEEQSVEWGAYLNTGRTGRIDTDDVKVCLEQIMNRMILAGQLEPKDPKRFFTRSQRKEIFELSGCMCAWCEIKLSETNFHADHLVPHSQGGTTTIDNGQALCTACNKKKGGNNVLFAIAH